MKIGSFDNQGKKPVTPATGQAVAPTADKSAAALAMRPESSAKVALSPAAARLVNDSNAEFDAEKVARIAQAIRDGKFKVNAEAIADKLIANAKELLAGPQH
jgi:negative regulator of flagellin synthesis FlgM